MTSQANEIPKITGAIVFTEPGQARYVTMPLPELGPDQVLLRTLVSGVSTGTETRVFSGTQVGSQYPLIPGYENIGVVAATAPDVTEFHLGDLAYVGKSLWVGPYHSCWGAHVQYAIQYSHDLIPLGTDLEPLEGVGIKTSSIAFRGVNRAKVKQGEIVAVVGLGLIGHMAAQIAVHFGGRVVGFEPDPERRKAATNAGIQHVFDPTGISGYQKIVELFGRGADVVIDATGASALLESSIGLLEPKGWQSPWPESGRVVMLGSYTNSVSIHYSPWLFDYEPILLPSRDSDRSDMENTAQLINDGFINPTKIPYKVFKPEQAQQAYEGIVNKEFSRVYFDWR